MFCTQAYQDILDQASGISKDFGDFLVLLRWHCRGLKEKVGLQGDMAYIMYLYVETYLLLKVGG